MKSHLKAFLSTVSLSPALHLVGLGVSFLLYIMIPAQLVPAGFAPWTLWAGSIIIVLATGLVFWAQSVSRQDSHRAQHAPTCKDFMRGPYRFARHPGSLGLMMMFLGFVLITNSLVMAILLVVTIAIETFWFIPWEEKTYLEECPEAYAEYKNKVRMWL